MKLITDTWRGLVRRKLWPVALLLLGALVAVPLTLAKEPEAPAAPPANLASADEGLPAVYVTDATAEEAEEDGTAKRRRTLGKAKDPFEPAPLPKANKKKKAKAAETEPASEPAASEPSAEPTTGGGATGGSDAPAAAPTATPEPTATATPAPRKSARVRFSIVTDDAADEAEPTTVERLQVLPDEENPVVVFRGLEQHGKVAVFELTGNVSVEGDTSCEPTPEACEVVKLRVGETVFITVKDTGELTDNQYQLDLVKIHK